MTDIFLIAYLKLMCELFILHKILQKNYKRNLQLIEINIINVN